MHKKEHSFFFCFPVPDLPCPTQPIIDVFVFLPHPHVPHFRLRQSCLLCLHAPQWRVLKDEASVVSSSPGSHSFLAISWPVRGKKSWTLDWSQGEDRSELSAVARSCSSLRNGGIKEGRDSHLYSQPLRLHWLLKNLVASKRFFNIMIFTGLGQSRKLSISINS